jgi:nucleotide-binding universal stress UspA family protein
MKNILIATDFSNNAYCALFYAAKLLESKKCTFYLLNTYSELTSLKDKLLPGFGGKKLIKQLETESKEKLESVFYKIVLDTENPNHVFETISQKGALVTLIEQKLEELNIDLLVMGNKGLTEAADIFFGSNTIQTISKMNTCPVLAVPGEMNFVVPNEIAFVTDFKKDCNRKSIAPLLYVASITNAAIKVIHINEKKVLTTTQESNRKLLMQCLQAVEHTFHVVHEFDDKAKVIDVVLKKLKIDMYAMVNYKHNLFKKLTHEPIIKDVSMYSNLPFLILPSRD